LFQIANQVLNSGYCNVATLLLTPSRTLALDEILKHVDGRQRNHFFGTARLQEGRRRQGLVAHGIFVATFAGSCFLDSWKHDHRLQILARVVLKLEGARALVDATGATIFLKPQISEGRRDGLGRTFVVLLTCQLPRSRDKGDPNHVVQGEGFPKGLGDVGGDGRWGLTGQVKRVALGGPPNGCCKAAGVGHVVDFRLTDSTWAGLDAVVIQSTWYSAVTNVINL